MPWQKTAAALLQDNLDQESSLLATPSRSSLPPSNPHRHETAHPDRFAALWLQGCDQPVDELPGAVSGG